MHRMNVLLYALLLAACGGGSGVAPVIVPAAGELQWIDTLRAVDEKGDSVVGAANFQSSRKDLSTFGDEAAHAHRKRTDEIEQWRASSFANASTRVELPPCAQREFRVAAKAPDVEIIDALLAHRECALSYANEALSMVRSSTARRVLDEAIRTFTAELQQLRVWRTAWQ